MTGTRELGRKIKDEADAEAAKAETEPDIEPTEPTGPTEPTPDEDEEAAEDETPTTPEPSGLSPEQMAKTMERAVDAFHAKLCKLFEVESLEPSSTPGVLGFVLPGYSEPKTHSKFMRCATCNGYGKVLTGSMREGYKDADCPDERCNGRGYWQKPDPVQVPQPQTLVPLPQPNGGQDEWAPAPAWMGDTRVAPQPPPQVG